LQLSNLPKWPDENLRKKTTLSAIVVQISQIIAAREFGIDCCESASETKMWTGGLVRLCPLILRNRRIGERRNAEV